MKDMTKNNITELSEYIFGLNQKYNLFVPTDLKEKTDMLARLMRVNMELSEAAEAAYNTDYQNFSEEIADVLILLLDICGACKIDIEKEIVTKLNKIFPEERK